MSRNAIIAVGILCFLGGLLLSQMFWMEVFARPGLDRACAALGSTKEDAALLANCINNSTRWATWLGVGIGIASAALIWFGFQQAERTSRMEYRSYIKIDAEFTGKLNKSSYDYKLTITNYGRTPAFDLDIYYALAGKLFHENAVLTADDELPGANTSKSYIIEIPEVRSDNPNPLAEVCMTVDVYYKDVFGTRHSHFKKYRIDANTRKVVFIPSEDQLP